MILIDFMKQKLVDKLGGWQSATACHFNNAVYQAKCKYIDSIDEIELAKASFKGGNVKKTSNPNDPNAPAEQLVSLDDIV